jgi:DNA-binding NarL/FixJ family response regulator
MYNIGMPPARVLLADDHAVVRAGIRKVLEEMPGLEVVGEVGSGPELGPALVAHRPDCLLIDVAMPEFDPIPAIRRIRDEYPELKILVVSAHKDDIYIKGLLGAGVNGYHLKDQPLKDLQFAIQRVLDGELWLSSPLIDRLVRQPEPFGNSPFLTLRQQELLRLLLRGMDNQAIAFETGLSIKTVENHLTRLYRVLRVQSRLEAVNYVMQHPEILGVSGESAIQSAVRMEIGSAQAPTVLVVDDNARYRQQLQRMIGKVCPQATIFEAGDIAAAAHLARQLSPQLVLVDVVLGDAEDGIRCTRRIKALSPQSRVILISAYPDREFHRLGLEAGAVAFLDKKDLDAPTLRQVFEDLVD